MKDRLPKELQVELDKLLALYKEKLLSKDVNAILIDSMQAVFASGFIACYLACTLPNPKDTPPKGGLWQ